MYPNFKRHLPRSYIMGTLIRRREDPEYATEMLDEIGTTDETIGDVTAEIMITTEGEIPDEMYDLDESSIEDDGVLPEGHHETHDGSAPVTHMDGGGRTHMDMDIGTHMDVGTPMITHEKNNEGGVSGFAAHSTLFTVLLVALLLLILLCCVSACVIARARRKNGNSSDMECDSDCKGAKQPLISSDKMSDTTSKSSAVSTRH